MRRSFVFVFLALAASDAFAQTADQALFVPGNSVDPPRVVYQTGETSVVITGYKTLPPACPKNAFWQNGSVSLISCDDGTAYRFVPLANPDMTTFKNALMLEKIGEPGPGTDDPGPMKHQGGEKEPAQ